MRTEVRGRGHLGRMTLGGEVLPKMKIKEVNFQSPTLPSITTRDISSQFQLNSAKSV
jgi:hypothetical protein